MDQVAGGAGRKVATLPRLAKSSEMTARIKDDNAKTTFAQCSEPLKINTT